MTSTAPAAIGTESDQAEVAGLTQRVVAAWAHHDADGFANVFTDDGTMILPGVFRQGREAIREFMAEAFTGQYAGTQVTGRPIDLRFVAPDVAVLHTVGGVLQPGRTEIDSESAIRATWFAVRGADGWRLAAYQNSPRD